uniref:C-C motif chemokine n=1 Tax=Otus sunia TaxID=257818 RepID=A0A8C8BJ40_9STRI
MLPNPPVASILGSMAAWAKWVLFTLLFSFIPAQSNQDCCLSYTKVRLPRWALKGYTEQLSSEVCDIHAIIFHTYSGLNACVNPKEGWESKNLNTTSL